MRPKFRDNMAWLHTWSGLVVGWILYAIFLTGTLAYFQNEITEWMQPELSVKARPETALEQAQAYLEKNAMNTEGWFIALPHERYPLTQLFWRNKEPDGNGRNFTILTLDGNGEETKLRDSEGGMFLYRFHFDLHYIPALYARWIVGFCSMFMLVAIVTGIVIHKKIFKDFFSFQPGKGPRSWMDAHTVTSVLALPFHLMITYTGLVTLMFMYLNWSVSLAYEDRGTLFDELFSQSTPPEAAGEPGNMVSLQSLYNDALRRAPDITITNMQIVNPGDANAQVMLRESERGKLVAQKRTFLYAATSGKLLQYSDSDIASEITRQTMVNLHAGRFASPGLRWLYFISGVLGTLMVATGLFLWSKSRQKRLKTSVIPFSHKLVAQLNAGFILGMPVAVGCYLLANRLAPINIDERHHIEINAFFLGWLCLLIYPLMAGVSRAWRHGSLLLTAIFAALPLVSIFFSPRHMLNYQYREDASLIAMDLTLFAFSVCCYLWWRWLHRQHSTKKAEARVDISDGREKKS